MAGHTSPEAFVGGPIAAVRDGDIIVFDVVHHEIQVELSETEIRERLRHWKAPAPRFERGVFAKYAATVSSASYGAVTEDMTKKKESSLSVCV
jgi:dihydroxy-acid dehydratase